MKKIKKRFLPLFLVTALLFIAAAALIADLPARREARGWEDDDAHAFVLLLEGVEQIYEPQLHIGDRIIDRRSRRILGDILAVESAPAVREIFSEARGGLTDAALPQKKDIRLTVTAKADGARTVTEAGEVLRIGAVYHFRTYGFTGEGRVIALL